MKYYNISEQIRRVLIEKKLTTVQLGAIAGINRANISNYKNDTNPASLNMVRKIAEGLGLTVEAFLGYSPEEEATKKDDDYVAPVPPKKQVGIRRVLAMLGGDYLAPSAPSSYTFTPDVRPAFMKSNGKHVQW